MVSPAEAAAKLDRLTRALGPEGRATVVKEGATVAKREMLEAARIDMGGDLSLSNWKGSRVMVGFDVHGDSALVRGRDTKGGAVWHVLESGAGRHAVSRKSRKRKRGRGAPSLMIGGAFVGRSVMHPGTRGKDTWSAGAKKLAPTVQQAMSKKLLATVRQAVR